MRVAALLQLHEGFTTLPRTFDEQARYRCTPELVAQRPQKNGFGNESG